MFSYNSLKALTTSTSLLLGGVCFSSASQLQNSTPKISPTLAAQQLSFNTNNLNIQNGTLNWGINNLSQLTLDPKKYSIAFKPSFATLNYEHSLGKETSLEKLGLQFNISRKISSSYVEISDSKTKTKTFDSNLLLSKKLDLSLTHSNIQQDKSNTFTQQASLKFTPSTNSSLLARFDKETAKSSSLLAFQTIKGNLNLQFKQKNTEFKTENSIAETSIEIAAPKVSLCLYKSDSNQGLTNTNISLKTYDFKNFGKLRLTNFSIDYKSKDDGNNITQQDTSASINGKLYDINIAIAARRSYLQNGQDLFSRVVSLSKQSNNYSISYYLNQRFNQGHPISPTEITSINWTVNKVTNINFQSSIYPENSVLEFSQKRFNNITIERKLNSKLTGILQHNDNIDYGNNTSDSVTSFTINNPNINNTSVQAGYSYHKIHLTTADTQIEHSINFQAKRSVTNLSELQSNISLGLLDNKPQLTLNLNYKLKF